MILDRLTVLVAGMVAGAPRQGGAAWAVLQYVHGLAELGHDVYLVEPVPGRRPDPASAAYFTALVRAQGLDGRAALLGTEDALGVDRGALARVAGRADVLFNLAGMLTDERLLDPVPVRIYVDLDPGFTQLWHAAEGIDMRLAGHTHHVTVGPRVAEPDCPIPDCGLEWIGTVPPVVLNRWPEADDGGDHPLTTVANWRGYGSITHRGVHYGQKAHSLRPLIRLPELAGVRFRLALGIHPDERSDLEALRTHGWELVDPVRVAATPGAYRSFLQASRAEFGVAKSGYVAGRTGWFSDRSVCYLACGRPVIAQDTGFGASVPTGEGLFAFQTVDDVVTAVEEIGRDYQRQCRAARELAETHFSSRRVLPRLLERVA